MGKVKCCVSSEDMIDLGRGCRKEGKRGALTEGAMRCSQDESG